MPIAGRKPKDPSQRRNRMPAVHDWTEVENTPYAGERPRLPVRQAFLPESETSIRVAWPAATKRWWESVSRMPHCRLWSEADWTFALDTAEAHARWTEGRQGANAAEVRIREKRLGTTLDARRDLRIRYVDPKPAEPDQPATVTRLDDYRDLYG